MTNILYKKSFNRALCLVLASVFLSSFLSGATALALCLDVDKTHVVDQQYLFIADCHSSNDTNNLINNQPNSTLIGREENDCVDVSLSNKNAFNRPSKITLQAFAKVILSYSLPESQLRFQQQLAGYRSSALTQPQFPSPFINAQRTVVLLI